MGNLYSNILDRSTTNTKVVDSHQWMGDISLT
jgi:hypothetical protein